MYQNFIIPYLYEAQRVLGDTPPIIRSLKLHWQPLVFHTWKVVGCVVSGRCQAHCKIWNNKNSDTLLHLVGFSLWIEMRRLFVVECLKGTTASLVILFELQTIRWKWKTIMNEKVRIWEAVMAYFKIFSEDMENLGLLWGHPVFQLGLILFQVP